MKTKLLEQAINRVLNEASGNPKKTYESFKRKFGNANLNSAWAKVFNACGFKFDANRLVKDIKSFEKMFMRSSRYDDIADNFRQDGKDFLATVEQYVYGTSWYAKYTKQLAKEKKLDPGREDFSTCPIYYSGAGKDNYYMEEFLFYIDELADDVEIALEA